MIKVAGKSSIVSIDYCDYLKRQICFFFVKEYKANKLSNFYKSEFTTQLEMLFVVKFRTELLTLERLIILKDEYLNEDTLTGKKIEILNRIPIEIIDKARLNDDIRGLLRNKSLDLVPIDFLIKLLEQSNFNNNQMNEFLKLN